MSASKPFSLHKSRHIMKWVYNWYKKKGSTLKPDEKSTLEMEMTLLDDALLAKDKQKASELARKLENFGSVHCKKTIFEYGWELFLALIFALIIATLVRQTWFELYEIPTGSMRPTFRELDNLTVSKTAFGINFPLETKHLYFDPDLVQRTSVLIFSGDGLPLPDVDTTYFGIFPYKKRYIKRLIGKPGDSLYFYGGQIYGVDKNGNDLTELRNAPWMTSLEYIPYLSFEGDVSSNSSSILFKQMNRNAGKLSFNILGQPEGIVFDGKEWIQDDPSAQATPHNTVKTYSDLLGMRNYAEARLLTKDELKTFPGGTQGLEDAPLYLQLRHTPSLNYPKPLAHKGIPGSVVIPGYTAVIPLQQKHLNRIMDNIYTSRFIVENGKATAYRSGKQKIGNDSPAMTGVADGTYEFYHGKAVSLFWGIESEVSKENPLYSHSPENIQKLFNLGIEVSTYFNPRPGSLTPFPHRYAYFRDGDLYLMGAPIITKDDPILDAFHKNESEKQAKSDAKTPYVAFKDYGAPSNAEFIKTFGITLPEGQYLVLGDNHAVSADSRVFGFVPQNNLQGAPCLIIWPPGDRLGHPAQKPYPFMNLPRAIVWTVAGIIFILWYVYHRRNLRKRIFKKLTS